MIGPYRDQWAWDRIWEAELTWVVGQGLHKIREMHDIGEAGQALLDCLSLGQHGKGIKSAENISYVACRKSCV
jgi:hypothetical protein